MACWDELCLICGLRPEGGPRILFEDLDASLKMIIRSLEEQDIELKPSREQVIEDIRKVLLLFDTADHCIPTNYEEAIERGTKPPGTYFPFTYEYKSWDGWNAIAIGLFDEHLNGETQYAKGQASSEESSSHLLIMS